MVLRSPRAEEIELLTATLRVIPDMVERRSQDDPTPERFSVSAGPTPMTITAHWVVDVTG